MANPSEMDPNEFLMGGAGYRSASFKEIGASVTGYVLRMDMRQQSDPATKELKVWKDGSPRMQMRIVLATDERDPAEEEDTGERAIYARGQMRQAIADAVLKVGARDLQIGGKVRVTYVANGPVSSGALQAPKVYEAQYRPPTAATQGQAQTNGHPTEEFNPQPVPRARDEAPAQRPVHDPAPF